MFYKSGRRDISDQRYLLLEESKRNALRTSDVSKLGGGGFAIWEFFPHNHIFFSKSVPDQFVQIHCKNISSLRKYWKSTKMQSILIIPICARLDYNPVKVPI